MTDYRLVVQDVDDSNRAEKYQAAVARLQKAMGVKPDKIKQDVPPGEKWAFKAQSDLAESITKVFDETTKEILQYLSMALVLPTVTTIRKSENLMWRGKVIFHPETGKPIKKSDFDKLILAIEKFLNRKLKGIDKKLVLEPRVLARLLGAMAKKQGSPDAAMKNMTLQDVVQRERSWGPYTATLGNYAARYNVTPVEADQVYLAIAKVGEYVVDAKWKTVKGIKLSLLDGIQQRKSRGEIAQDLFDKMGDLNRDWRRIAETETADNFNNAFLRMESAKAKPGTKVYFKRTEMFDDHVCKYCLPYRGKIVLWSEAALPSDKIEDEWTDTAVWEGKSNVGRKAKDYWLSAGPIHPHCRGSWAVWTPPTKGLKVEYQAAESKLNTLSEKRKAVRAQMLAEGWDDRSEKWPDEFKRRIGELK